MRVGRTVFSRIWRHPPIQFRSLRPCKFIFQQYQTRDKTFNTRTYAIDIVDQVGRGDSFAAGFLYGYISRGDVQKGLDYGVAFAALKHSFPGDFNWNTKEEVEALLAGAKPGVNR